MPPHFLSVAETADVGCVAENVEKGRVNENYSPFVSGICRCYGCRLVFGRWRMTSSVLGNDNGWPLCFRYRTDENMVYVRCKMRVDVPSKISCFIGFRIKDISKIQNKSYVLRLPKRKRKT